jgi:hypothetical protein
MQSLIAPLAWEYYARNRWKLLLPLIANIPASLILLPFAGLESAVDSKLLVLLQIILTLTTVAIVCFSVQESQGRFNRFYLKPISTIQLVSFYYWTGAFLVALAVGSLLTLWNWIVPLELDIAGPVLFAVVSWCSFQPLARGFQNSVGWIASVFVLLSLLLVWYLQHYGLVSNSAGSIDSKLHPWSPVSLADILLACFVLTVSFALTIWRVAQDRCRTEQYDWVFVEKFVHYVEWLLGRRSVNQKHFLSPAHALCWLDFKYRCSFIPTLVIINSIAMWISAVLSTNATKNLQSTPSLVASSMHTVTFLQPCIALVLSMAIYFGSSLRMPQFLGYTSIYNPFGIEPYLFRLPVQSKVLAGAMLRSSCQASLMGFAVLLTSFTLAGILGQILNTPMAETMSLKIPYWKFILIASSASSIATFAFSLFPVAFLPLVMRAKLWIAPFVILAALLAFKGSIPLSIAGSILIVVLCVLVAATIQALMDNDVSLVKTLGIWTIGIGLSFLALKTFPDSPVSIPSLLAIAVIGLAILPFFSTAAMLRKARSS